MPLEMLNLSARPYHALSRIGIKTVEEESHQIPYIANLGKKGRAEIADVLKNRGYSVSQLMPFLE